MHQTTYHEPAREVPIVAEYDVLVCGGGTSGISAAIAAARTGARVGLVERYGFIGGVPAYCIMPAWHSLTDTYSRLLGEFATRVTQVGPGPNPFATQHMEPEHVKHVALAMVTEAGVSMHLHTGIVDVMREGRAVTGVVTESKSGRRAIRARTLIDATGDGDVATFAGAEYQFGNAEGVSQGMTVRFRIGNIDFARYFDWLDENRQYVSHNDDYLLWVRERALRDEPFFMAANLVTLYQAHPEWPNLPVLSYFNGSSIRPRELSLNATRVFGLDGTNADHLSEAEIACRTQEFALWAFLRRHVPGFADSFIVETAAQIGVRETRRIVGDYILSEEDCRLGTVFADSIVSNPIAFDLHDTQYTCELLAHRCHVPYRCLLPRGIEGLLVAGRCISTDHVANSTIRRMMTAFETGQVAGIAAALTGREQTTPRALPFEILRAGMQEAGMPTPSDEMSA